MSGINPSDQSELSRLFSGTSAGHCLTCGSEKVEVTCGMCDGTGKAWLWTQFNSRRIKCPTCQGRGVRTVCGVCNQVAQYVAECVLQHAQQVTP